MLVLLSPVLRWNYLASTPGSTPGTMKSLSKIGSYLNRYGRQPIAIPLRFLFNGAAFIYRYPLLFSGIAIL